MPERMAGVLVPLSALRSRRDCGIGDFSALGLFFAWMREAGLSILQILPIHNLEPKSSCPYAALSAFALDPAYAALGETPEAAAVLRSAPRVRFAQARALKLRELKASFARFKSSKPPESFEAFVEREREWLEDYVLFHLIKEETGWKSWLKWPDGLKNHEAQALKEFSRTHSRGLSLNRYLQWVLHEQWQSVRRQTRENGILLYGDIPFGLHLESADVWARQREFDLDYSIGAPPDRYSATGQAWGLPAYRWNLMEREGHAWWRSRIRRSAELFDLFRIDHAVGVFRTWIMPKGSPKKAHFDLEGAQAQKARGERFFKMVLEEAGESSSIAEDLGLIPSYVHEVLSKLKIPGYKVTRWEMKDGRFQNPRAFPPLSVATTGNHDTSALAAWWEEIPRSERDAYWAMATGARKAKAPPRFNPNVHERVLENLYQAGSGLVILPFQDILGTRERINTPATVGAHNWTYRIPCPVEELSTYPPAADKARLLKRLAEESGRLSPVATPQKTC